jgi:hypothetical protein
VAIMTGQNTTSPSTPTVVAAPPGLTAIDASGKALPIVALRIEPGDDYTVATPLYLGESGRVLPVWDETRFGLSEAWARVSTTADLQQRMSD